MFRPRLCGRARWASALALPPLAWVLVVLLAPTGWVRARLVARLEAATGRSVAIDSVQLGWTGNLRVAGLSFAEPRTPADPWLRIARARVDVHLGQVLLGCCTPGEVVVDGVALRVWRRADGRFEFGDLGRTQPTGPAPAGGGPSVDLFPALDVRVADALITYIDDASNLRLALRGVEARGSYRAQAARIDELTGQLNGGSLTLAAQVVRDPKAPRYAAEVRARKVHIDPGCNVVEALLPVVGRSGAVAGGMFSVELAVTGQGASAAEIRRTLAGRGSILLDPIDLDGSRILAELQSLGDWPSAGCVGAVSASFVVDRGRLISDDLTIRAPKVPFVVAGWTDFDGRFDYTTRVDRMVAALPRDARTLLGELQVNLDGLADLRIEGRGEQVRMTLNGKPIDGDDGNGAGAPGVGDRERVKFRAAARQIRDRFFR